MRNYKEEQEADVNVEVSHEEHVEAEPETEYVEDSFEPPIDEKKKESKRNMINVEKVALAAVRYNVGDRPTAAISTAALECNNIVTNEDKLQVIDHHKIARAKNEIMEKIKV